MPAVRSRPPLVPFAPIGACLAAAAALLAAAPDAGAQAAPDSAARRDSAAARLDPVVVTAERAAAPLTASAAAVTRLSAEALRRLPTQTVAAAMELVPGIAVLHSDALGDAPRLVARGFYGGGETEYVAVLLDGVPLTGLATGQVNWDLVPLAALEAVEVVRGGASAAHGDAAVGGVVNLVTRRDTGAWRTWRLTGGELGTLRAGGAAGGRLGARAASAFADVRRSDGYRAHERRASGALGGAVDVARGAAGWLALSTLHHRREVADPGPLRGETLAAGRRASASPFFRFDDVEERVHRVGLDGGARVAGGARLAGYLTGEHARAGGVRTQPLSADFADAQRRETRADRVLGSVQVERPGVVGRVATRVVVGADVAAGRLATAYRSVVTGDSAAFAEATGEAGDVAARGRGERVSGALFGNLEVAPHARVRLALGGRLDRIADDFTPRAPSEGEGFHSSRTAWSPRVGANVRYAEGARHAGSAYVTAGRSFKAPTVDQLFDQRATPIPFEPFQVVTSNPELVPQYGANVEVGAYHRVALGDGLAARLAASVYQMDMRDELDFDLEQFRYVNIGRSRHRGAEVGLTLDGPRATGAFLNVTRQDVTARSGDAAGRQLKAVPRAIVAGGASWAPARGPGLAVTATSVRGAFLDDANAERLAPYTRVDARASWALGGARLAVGVRNLLGAEYSTSGFPDPAGGDARLFYPAATRVVTVGLESLR